MGSASRKACLYNAERDLYVAVNAGIAQDVIPNDGYISLVNPDGTAHTLKWMVSTATASR